MKDCNASIIINGEVTPDWSPQTHHLMEKSFRKSVVQFLLILKRNQKKTNLKIPKFVIYEILKKIN